MNRPPFTLVGLARDTRGLAAIEFAIIVPVLIFLYVGSFELMQGVYAYRKVSATAHTVADLTSQYTTMAETDLTNVMSASTQVMAPFSPAGTMIVISEISTDAKGQGSVTWSRASGTTRLTPGVKVVLSPGLAQPNMTFLQAQVTYKFNPFGDGALIAPMMLHMQVYMLPRLSTIITVPSP